MKPPPPKERAVQRSILKMAGIAFPDVLIHHSPNGAHLAGNDQARFKQMGALLGDGLKKGFPDLICVWNRGVAFLEVKRKGGRLSTDQVAMHARLSALGHDPAVVTSAAQAFAFLRDRGAPTNLRGWTEA